MATIRALECLVAIADTGSLTAAAVELHLTQPALSHQIRVLEQEVGAPVVDRLPRGVRLTAVGAAMLAAARTAVPAAALAVALGRSAARGDSGVLRIACAESMTAGLLAPVLTAWRAEHPDVSIELVERSSADALAADVASGLADLAIGPRPSPIALEVVLLGRERMFVVAAPGHPLAHRSSVRLGELRGEPFIHLDRTNGLAGWIDAVAAAAGVVLDPVVRVRAATSAAALALSGLGVALVPASAVPHRDSGSLVPLDPTLERDIVALHRPPAQPLVAAFCALVRSTAELFGEARS